MIAAVERTLYGRGLALPGEPLWVAVSGGVDSMVLLHVLRTMGHPVQVVHVDHGMRGAESDADRDHVEAACDSLGVPCRVERVEVKAHADAEGISPQMAARELRYAIFRRLAVEGPHKLALAHHADDAVETLFMHLLRGMGARGWNTIPFASGPFIRPLLEVERATILDHARRHGIGFREDASNRDPKYLRNRIRHELMPLLEDLRHGAARVLKRDVALLREVDALVRKETTPIKEDIEHRSDGSMHVPLVSIRSSPAPGLLLHALLAQHGFHPDALDDLREALRRGATGATFHHGPMRVVVDRDHLVIGPATDRPVSWTIDSPGSLPEGVPLRITTHAPGEVDHQNGRVAWMDGAEVRFPLVLRPWRAGDRMRPLGLGGSKLVSDLLTDAKVPNHLREQAMVLESEGRILWLCGLRLAEEARVQDGDVLRMEYQGWSPLG